MKVCAAVLVAVTVHACQAAPDQADTTEARKTYEEVAASQTNNIERALAYPEAQRKLSAG